MEVSVSHGVNFDKASAPKCMDSLLSVVIEGLLHL